MKADVAGRLREFASRTDLHESASSATNGGTEVLDGNVMERIQGLMGEILDKSSAREGTCLYRGEPECYAIVSSGLYRAWSDSENEAFKIGRMEQEIVERARHYTTLADDEEILAEIQHFGGATNLLDFTDDYLIALFFASVKNEGADGRVVLHWPDLKTVIRPKHTNNRVVFQKSVFVRPRRGFIVPDAREGTVVVSGDLKVSILTFLERFHGISERSVYNDMHGYIRNQNLGRSQYAAEFRETLAGPNRCKRLELGDYLAARPGEIARVNMRNYSHQKGMEYTDQAGSEFAIVTLDEAGPKTQHCLLLQPDQVVDLVSHCIENNDDRVRMAEAYCWRGDALLFLGSTSAPQTISKGRWSWTKDWPERITGALTYAGGKVMSTVRGPIWKRLYVLIPDSAQPCSIEAICIEKRDPWRTLYGITRPQCRAQEGDRITLGSETVTSIAQWRGVSKKNGVVLRQIWNWQENKDFGSHCRFGTSLAALRDSKATMVSSCRP